MPIKAYAYLDPGTGSLIVQAIVGSVAAAGAAIGLYWARIKNFFNKNKNDPSNDDKTLEKETD